MPTYDAFQGRPRNPFWADPRYGAPEIAPQGIAPPDIAGALADPQFRADIIRGLQDAGLGTLQGLTTDSLGAPVDILNMAMQPFGVGAETPVGGSEWLQRHAVEAGLMDPPKDNLQYNAGRFLGPVAAMGIPDMAGAFAGKIADAAVDFAGHSGRLNPFAGQAGAVGSVKATPADEAAEAAYRGMHTAPMRNSGAPLHDLTAGGTVYPDDIYSANAYRYYGHFGGGDPMDKETIKIIHSFKNKPDAEVTIYRAVPADENAAGINAGDWITVNRKYAKSHGESVLDGQYKILSKKVKARDIFTNGDSIHEYGYDPSPD